MPSAALGLLLVAQSQLPLSAKLELPTGQVVQISADNQTFEGKAQRTVARGHAELRTEGAQLRADEISYQGTDQIAEAKGHVMLVLTAAGSYAAVADAVRVRIDQGQVSEVFVDSGLVM